MVSANRIQRERELVALLLFDKPALIGAYRRAMNLPQDSSLFGVLDRDMIRAILDSEFPPARRLATSQRWSTTDEHRYWTA
jgi:hypothetical protein